MAALKNPNEPVGRLTEGTGDAIARQQSEATGRHADEAAIEVLSQQDQAIDAVSRLLNALLDISKLESGGIKPAPQAAASLALSGASQSGVVRILLVEDNASVRRAMSRLLGLEGFSVTSVASKSEAIEHVQNGNGVDLLICDYHLNGGETGTQVIAALREILGKSLRALLATGDTSPAIKQLPRDPYLRFTSKPIKAGELLTLLRALLAA